MVFLSWPAPMLVPLGMAGSTLSYLKHKYQTWSERPTVNNKHRVITLAFQALKTKARPLFGPGQSLYSRKAFLFQLLNKVQYFLLVIVYIYIYFYDYSIINSWISLEFSIDAKDSFSFLCKELISSSTIC